MGDALQVGHYWTTTKEKSIEFHPSRPKSVARKHLDRPNHLSRQLSRQDTQHTTFDTYLRSQAMNNHSHPLPDDKIDLEVRPGGMLVQRREDADDADGVGPSGPLITVMVSHGQSLHQLNVPAQACFGDLKKLLARATGLDPKYQRLLFRGKEKEDTEYLHMVGVKDRSKVLLLQDPASKEKRHEEVKKDHEEVRKDHEEVKQDPVVSKASEAVNKVKVEVDKLAEKVSVLESTVRSGNKVDEKEFALLTELLMVQLLKLDGIEAEGVAKTQRRLEVRRIQSYVETLDSLKARNSNPFSDTGSTVSVTTKWEKFDSGFGSLSAPPPIPSTTVTQDWEDFD